MADLFQPSRAHFPVRPGKLLSRYFFYGNIEAACGELLPSELFCLRRRFFMGTKKQRVCPIRATLPVFAYRQKQEADGRAIPAPMRYFPVRPGKLHGRYFFHGK